MHELTLVAIDSCNNLDTIHSVLEVDCLDDVLMYVPTAFTPNGDGVNDQYCITSSMPERTSYAIYDRWGMSYSLVPLPNAGIHKLRDEMYLRVR